MGDNLDEEGYGDYLTRTAEAYSPYEDWVIRRVDALLEGESPMAVSAGTVVILCRNDEGDLYVNRSDMPGVWLRFDPIVADFAVEAESLLRIKWWPPKDAIPSDIGPLDLTPVAQYRRGVVLAEPNVALDASLLSYLDVPQE